MATAWVKSLHCKSRVLEDVEPLLATSSCRKSLKDIVETSKKKPRKANPTRPSKTEHGSNPTHHRVRPPITARPARTLTELPEGHPSRNVVEIIFHTSWSPKEFSGRIEMVFKLQNLPKTVARFEEYREIVKSRARSARSGSTSNTSREEDNARCIADGNEVMRFHCLGPAAGGIYDTGDVCTFYGKEGTICTFSGSGEAHESAGGGKGRRAMLVCRVIAGRVFKRLGRESFLERRIGFDSVSGENGELLVFDSQAVLPCFLIFYKL